MPDAIHVFFSSGCRYYVAGRYAAFAGLNPVAGNVMHHAIEQFLKGGLSKTKSLPQLKRLMHRLPDIWEAFKQQANDPTLARFDTVILELHRFEDIRYPDAIVADGMQCVINITKAGAAVMTHTSSVPMPPSYQLCLEEIDELVSAIFVAASRNPKAYFQSVFKPEAREYLVKGNTAKSIADVWAKTAEEVVMTNGGPTMSVVRGPESWPYIYTVLGFVLTIESTVIGMMTPLDFPWNVVVFAAIAVITVWLFIDNAWVHNRLIGLKIRYENKPR
jgi:hypothetical protein